MSLDTHAADTRLIDAVRKLRGHLMVVAKGRDGFITDLMTLATATGLDVETVRTSAAVLMLNGDVEDIRPAPEGRLNILMQG